MLYTTDKSYNCRRCQSKFTQRRIVDYRGFCKDCLVWIDKKTSKEIAKYLSDLRKREIKNDC